MNPVVVAFEEKVLIKLHAAIGTRIEFHHPTAHAVGVELLVPCRVKRVREIDSFAIAAHFHHLRSARERLIRLLRMRCAIGYATDTYRAGLLRIERVRYVVLQKLACSPARDVKEFVVQ